MPAAPLNSLILAKGKILPVRFTMLNVIKLKTLELQLSNFTIRIIVESTQKECLIFD
jgi:hypothetical protein